jgi:hypothetical protein
MTFRIGVRTKLDPDFVFNQLVFADEHEADGYRVDLFSRWTALVDARVFETEAAANVRWINGKLLLIDTKTAAEPEDEGHGI